MLLELTRTGRGGCAVTGSSVQPRGVGGTRAGPSGGDTWGKGIAKGPRHREREVRWIGPDLSLAYKEAQPSVTRSLRRGILFLLLGSMAMSVVVYSCSRSPLCCPDFTPYSHWPHRASAALPRPALPLVSPPTTALAGGPQGPTRHHCLAPTSVGLDTLWPHRYSHHSPYLIMGMPRRGLVGRAPRSP